MEPTREQHVNALAKAKADGNDSAVAEIEAAISRIDNEAMVESQRRRIDEMSTVDWLRETWKNASTQDVAFGKAVLDKNAEVQAGSFAPGNMPPRQDFMDYFQENNEAAQQFLRDKGVFDPNEYTRAELKMADPLGGWGTPIVEALGTPLGIPSMLTKALKPAKLAVDVAETAASGVTGEMGSQIAEQQFPESTIAPILGGAAGGGLGGPAVTSPARAAVSITATKAGDLMKRFTTEGAKEFEEGLASKETMNFLRNVSTEIGEANIRNIIDNFEKIRPIIGDEGLPTFVAMAESPTLQAEFIRLTRANPTARNQLQTEVNLILNKIEENSNTLFGKRDVTLGTGQVNPQVREAVTAAERAEQAIEARLFNLADIPRTPGDELGLKIRGLITAKEKAVRVAMGTDYQKLSGEARKAGVYLPAKGTAAIYDFVVQNNVRDIFGKTTQADRDIMSILTPKVTKSEPSKIVIPPGARTAPETKAPTTTRAFKPMSFDQIDSLKRAINAQIRDTNDPAQLAKLNQLKVVFNEQRKLLPEDWNQRLKDLDTQFYERVGVPYDNRTMRDLDSRAYAEKVSPILLNNASAAKQFVETLGPEEAMPILKTTILSKLQYDVVDLGKVNQAKLNNFVKKNRDTIDVVPGLREELDQLVANNGTELALFKAATDQVKDTQKRLDAAKALAADVDMGTYFGQLSKGLDNPKNLQAWEDHVSKLDPTMQTLMNDRMRREVLAQAVGSNGSLTFLLDPNKKTVMTRLFGKDYVKQLEGTARLADMIAKVEPEKIRFNPEKNINDPVERATNVPGKQFLSVVRDRIASNFQKAAILLSKANEGRVRDARDRKMLEVMLDPDAVSQLSKLVDDKGRPKFGLAETVERGANILAQRIVLLGYTGSSRAAGREETEEQVQELRQRLYQ